MRSRHPSRRQESSAAAPVDPEQAWKALALVNDWVKHAETKLATVLAATGVSGGILFNLVNDYGRGNLAFNIAAAVCCAAVIVAGVAAMTGLYPVVRLGRKTSDDSVNPLFFEDVARAYKGDAPSYIAVQRTLTANPDDLVRHVSQQIHANATVAQRKFRWANRAIRALLLDLVALAALASMIALRNEIGSW